MLVRKAGEIIPEVLSVVLDKRPADSRPYFLPLSLIHISPGLL